jgi:NAD(P)-dependent dehydrogenase (short-subunit alcohol dehydrogenase family)
MKPIPALARRANDNPMQNGTDYCGRTIALGGSSDTTLGRALAEAFAQRGATIVHVNGEPSGGPSSGVGIDALILLSRPPVVAPFLQLNETDWTREIQSDLLLSIRLIRAVGAGMVARQQGCIVVIGSLSGMTGWPGYAVSSTVDGALVALVRSLACEWAIHNVRVVYLACSAVDGMGGEATDDMVGQFAERTPLGHNATPEQIASVALYLAGPRASFITGSIVRADGGWTAWGLLK